MHKISRFGSWASDTAHIKNVISLTGLLVPDGLNLSILLSTFFTHNTKSNNQKFTTTLSRKISNTSSFEVVDSELLFVHRGSICMTMIFLSSQIGLNILLRPILFNSYFNVVVFLCYSVLPRFYETKDTDTETEQCKTCLKWLIE